MEQTEIQGNESQSSVEFQTNTKGFTTYKIKVYNPEPDGAYDKAVQLSEQARKYCEIKNKEIK